MGKLKINKIRIDNFNFEAFSKEYCILRLESTRKSYVYSAEILDTLKKEDSGAKSICYRGGNIYVLVSKKDEESVKRTCSRLITTKDLKAPCPVSPGAIPYIAVQLLINCLPGIGRMPDVNYVNLTGQMYCHHAAWEKKNIYVVLRITVKKDLSLVAEADTFSKKPASYEIKGKQPVYVLDENGYMQRTFDFGKKDLYMNRRFDNGKASIPFLNIQNEVEFLKTKMGVLSRVMSQYNKEFGAFHQLKFFEVDVENRMKKSRTEFQKMIKAPRMEWVNANGITIEDAIGDDYSVSQITRIKEFIESEYGDVIKASDSGPKLRLIHDKKWFEDNKTEDQHILSTDDGVQQITVETTAAAPKLDAIINTCINDLIIKDDLTRGRLSIGNLELDKDIVFGVQAKVPDDKTGKKYYLFLTISKDGGIKAEKREVDPFGEDAEDKMIDILMNLSEDDGRDLRGIIQYGDSIMTLFNTSMFTVSENDLIQGQMKENAGTGRATLVERTEENREVALVAITDINSFTFEGTSDTFYNVGVPGSGMNTAIKDASLIRRFHAETGEDFSQMLLPMMCEGHIRNEQLTVVPFPFKYLNEYAKMNCLEII